MAQAVKFIEVERPISTVYNQWTQFEDFPQFMEGVDKVIQRDDTNLHWVASIKGQQREWDAVITEQHPDERIAWKSVDGISHAGVVTFHKLDENLTRVTVQLDYAPDGVVEEIGDMLGFVERRVKGDLDRFKDFIESRPQETGAWRGNVDNN